MASNSDSSSAVISLPKGGGALHGLGETFAPDLHTGVGNFTIPISIPPGRLGVQPQLNLVYSTGSGNGPFGVGWSLSVPGVSRKTSRGIPQYQESDVFVLSGYEDLVPVAGAPAGSDRYRPRTEGSFGLIDRVRSGADDYWFVRSKDGRKSTYGTPAARGSDPAVVAHPVNRDDVFAWRLTRLEDPMGNCVLYSYARDRGAKDGREWDQIYLDRIRYVNYTDPNGNEQFLVRVTFDYGPTGEERADSFSEYRAGFEIRTRRLCRRILIESLPAAGPRMVRRYDFTYHYDPTNGAALLQKVELVGYDDGGAEARELPPLEFGYTRFEPERRSFAALQGEALPPSSLKDQDIELVDLHGNGLPDILEMNGAVRFWRNLGGGRFDIPRPMASAPAGVSLRDTGVQLIDANGDGRTDLLVTTPPLAGYYPLEFPARWDRRGFQRYREAPSFDLEDPEVRLIDLDGDGVTDAIRSGTRLECFFNDPHEGWTGGSTRAFERRGLADFPDVSFSDDRVKLADMSGDNLQDIVLVYDGNVEYWPNLGHGRWGKRLHMKGSPRFPAGYDPRRVLLGDVDGDGLADLVYVDHRRIHLWINRSGGAWSEPIVIEGAPPVTDRDSARLVDLLGTGMSGLLWSTDLGLIGPKNYSFLDFSGGIKPYLLNRMDNHLGAETRVEYRPSTHDYRADEERRETRWRTPLPFPVHVVARVEVVDGISRSKLVTECRYHHGYWDGAEREFRGFGMVEQLDTQSFADYHEAGLHGDRDLFDAVPDAQFSPPTLTRTWFHQGPVGAESGDWKELDYSDEYWSGDPQMLGHTDGVNAYLRTMPDRRARRDALRALRGRILRTELYALDRTARQDRPYTVTENAYDIRAEGRGVFFPFETAQRSTEWERGSDPMTCFRFTGNYDAFGQPRRQTAIACPRGWRGLDDRSTGYLGTRTVSEYATPTSPGQAYICDRTSITTNFDVLNAGARTVFEIRDLPDATSAFRIAGQSLTFYDRDPNQPNNGAFVGLPFGQVGEFGVAVRAEALVLTDELLADMYRSGPAVLAVPERPPYLDDPPLTWPADYPVDFRTRTPRRAGYVCRTGGPGSPYATGYFAQSHRRRFDFHDRPKGRGLLVVQRDPLDHDTRVDYDPYELFPRLTTDAAGMTMQAAYSYRVFQAQQLVDANLCESEFRYSALGLLTATWLKGDPAQTEGDRQQPAVRLDYDFLAFLRERQPIFVRTIRNVYHDTQTSVPVPERSATIDRREFSDGFGRVVQTRQQGEEVQFGDQDFGGGDEVLPASQAAGGGGPLTSSVNTDTVNPNVVVSGWQLYDNKGRVVEKYEPFFDRGWDYAVPGGGVRGQKATLYYDARGELVRTVNPDGSEQRVIRGYPGPGVTGAPAPDALVPTPWEAWTYDVNDNAGRTHAAPSRRYRHHWDTPKSVEIDPLGRPIRVVERNRARPADLTAPLPPIEELETKTAYDLRGNILSITDPLGRVAFRYTYDFGDRPWRAESIDAGLKRAVYDALGNEVERQDSKGALILRAYDGLGRLARVWARDGSGQTVTLRERIVYGDDPASGLTAAEVAARKLKAKIYQHYDEAGLLTCDRYDFKGNVLERNRRVIQPSVLASVFSPPPANWTIRTFRADWDLNPSTILEPAVSAYVTTVDYDALNRIRTLRYPADTTGNRRLLQPRYNRAGALESVALDGDTYVERIAYTAKGQRALVTYGNGIMTRYAYDPLTFRLERMRTDAFTRAAGAAPAYTLTGRVLQDCAYEFDLAGNILAIRDRAPQSGLPGTPDSLDRLFSYDAIYRLDSATGRECDTPPQNAPWEDLVRCTDPTTVRAYTQIYAYDRAGNLTDLQHVTGNNGSFTRQLVVDPASNRLAQLTVGTNNYPYQHDASGNMLGEATSRRTEWDHANRMKTFRVQAGNAEPSIHAQYLYDTTGQRVMKVVRTQGGAFETTVYVDGCFEHFRWTEAGQPRSNIRVHVMDNQSRIALVREGDVHPGDRGPQYQFHLGDHLESAAVIVGGASATSSGFLNLSQFFPFGEASFGGFAQKRYAFIGTERDEESGMAYHVARYYLAWLGRWSSCDRTAHSDGANLYRYARGNPVRLSDKNGERAGPGWLVAGGAEAAGEATGLVAASEGTGTGLAATAGGGGLMTVGLGLVALAAVTFAGYKTYQAVDAYTSLKAAEARAKDMQSQLQRAKERLDLDVENAWQTGYINDEEYDTYKSSGMLPKGFYTEMKDKRVGIYIMPPRHSGMPLWLQKIREGQHFNHLMAFSYQYRELYVIADCTTGAYTILDAYNPGREIVSRKNTQLSDISVETGIGYIKEILKKYPRGAKVADVTSSGLQTGCAPDLEGTFAGHKLSGRYILEVPRQIEPIPQAVLDAAKEAGVTIRDVYGHVYN